MDAIGSSTKLMCFFVFIYSFPILLLILSVAIWSYKKFKRFAFISYIADTTLTVLILLGDISNLVSRFIKDTPMYHYGIIETLKSGFIKENIDETIFMFALFKCGKSDKGRN